MIIFTEIMVAFTLSGAVNLILLVAVAYTDCCAFGSAISKNKKAHDFAVGWGVGTVISLLLWCVVCFMYIVVAWLTS